MANTIESSNVEITIKKPSRILYYSDGIEEVFDETECNELSSELVSNATEENVDPKTLMWGPWMWYYAQNAGTKVLNSIDYVGESLADFFGITTPKYQLEISEHMRIEEERKKLEDEVSGWIPNTTDGVIPLVVTEPLSNDQPRLQNDATADHTSV